jgi:hypothetical protein
MVSSQLQASATLPAIRPAQEAGRERSKTGLYVMAKRKILIPARNQIRVVQV